MTRIKQIGVVVIIVLVFIVVFDLIGVAANFVLDVLGSRRDSGLLRYAIWFVLGVFCGGLSFGAAAGDERTPGAPGVLILATMVVVVAGLVVICDRWQWQTVTTTDADVPDSMPHTLTFLIALLGGAALFRHSLAPPAAGSAIVKARDLVTRRKKEHGGRDHRR